MLTKVETTSGHLTAFDKKVILIMLNNGHKHVKTPKKVFKIEGNTVLITEPVMEWNGPRQKTYKSTFSVK
jgi:hypothetical protein